MQNTPNFADLPDTVRMLMKSSIEQARKAFDTFVVNSEKMLHGIDVTSGTNESVKLLNEKIAAFTKQNADANFDLAMKLAEARQMSEILEIQNTHVREQMEAFSKQMEELRDLTMKAVKEGTKIAGAAMQQNTPAGTFGG